MPVEVFNRYEHKYLLDRATYEKVLRIMDIHMKLDKHNKEHKPYTIANVYYDTPDDYLIRNSLSKPVYKEKLRLRAYGVPDRETKVFLEIRIRTILLYVYRTTVLVYQRMTCQRFGSVFIRQIPLVPQMKTEVWDLGCQW